MSKKPVITLRHPLSFILSLFLTKLFFGTRILLVGLQASFGERHTRVVTRQEDESS